MTQDVLPGKLLVVRHAESEWNALGKWTGLTDICLSPKGLEEAAQFGTTLKMLGIRVDAAFCSQQCRTHQTLEGMLTGAGIRDVPVTESGAINERDYGEYTGRNKWEMKELIGEEKFNDIRRGWDVSIPGGETLKMVYERAVPFYIETIVPQLAAGKNVLVVAHGNTIRALKKYIESVSDEGVADVEMPFGEILVYDVSPDGHRVRSHGATVAITPPNA
jgi:2,3-bisphosphoglycerate-dependent phosphoglycerate mutase